MWSIEFEVRGVDMAQLKANINSILAKFDPNPPTFMQWRTSVAVRPYVVEHVNGTQQILEWEADVRAELVKS